MRTVFPALAALAVLAAPSVRADELQAGPPAPQQALPKPGEKEGEKAPGKAADKPAEKKAPPVSAGSDGFSIQNDNGDSVEWSRKV